MKRAIISVLVGIVVMLCLFAYIAIFHAPSGKPPSWTYGVGKYRLFKSIVGPYELGLLLEEQKVDEFNKRRRQGIFAGKYLDLSRHHLVGKDLAGADLSKCVLKGCNFSGSDLRGVSFRNSYIAETKFCSPYSLDELPSPKMARRTNLQGADFTGAVLEADAYGWVEFGYFKVKAHPEGLSYCKLEHAVGLRMNLRAPEEMRLTDDGFRALVSPPPIGAYGVLDVSTPCVNPFTTVEESDYQAWKELRVDVGQLRSLHARRIEFSRPQLKKVVNSDSNLVVVVTDSLRGLDLVSTGPVVLTGETDSIIADGVLWLREEATAPQWYAGHPVIVSPGVRFFLDKAILSPVYREPGSLWETRLRR